MRVTEKGQVTIPRNIRQKLGIRPGTEVEFGMGEGMATLRPVELAAEGREREVGEFLDHIRRHKGTMTLGGLSADEFYSLLRD